MSNADTAEPQFCDNCGEDWDGFAAYSEVPVDVASANEGESAILCRPCCEKLDLQHNDGDDHGPDA
jgi:hypothetical protein